MTATVGRPAPEFSLEGVITGHAFKNYSLSEKKGKWVVLFFYPLDFTFICPTEITQFSKQHAEFEKLNAVVFGVSTDSAHSHKAWLKELGDLKYPLLSDMSHKVSREYGTLIEEQGISLRGTFIIDEEGMLRYSLIHDNGVGRSVKEILRALAALQSGELCPVEWVPGEKTLGKA
ncbi:MAG: peroxiredoxin [Patescibacteria group bacterium]